MTVALYALGHPLPATRRGGDCRARDLTQGRNVYGIGHHFAATTDLRISNGLIRFTIGAIGAVPTLTMECYQGPVTIGDVYTDVYTDIYPGSLSVPSWGAMGTVRIDTPSTSALLTGARLVSVSPEEVTVRLLCAAIHDANVTLRRGERMCRIQHGTGHTALARRVRLLDSPSPTGSASTGRVEETSPTTAGFYRFVAAVDPVTPNAGTFSLATAAGGRARFGAGVGTAAARDQPIDLHNQLGDASRPTLIVRAA